jgi:hypothetical protein
MAEPQPCRANSKPTSVVDRSISKAIAGAKTISDTGAISFAKWPIENGSSQLRGAELLIKFWVVLRSFARSYRHLSELIHLSLPAKTAKAMNAKFPYN